MFYFIHQSQEHTHYGNLEFTLGFSLIKSRTQAYSHYWFDVVRGTGNDKGLKSDTNDQEEVTQPHLLLLIEEDLLYQAQLVLMIQVQAQMELLLGVGRLVVRQYQIVMELLQHQFLQIKRLDFQL